MPIMTTDQSQPYQHQEALTAFTETENTQSTPDSFPAPPIPPNQEDIELRTPVETLDVLRDPTSDIRSWLSYIKNQYTPPDHTDILLLYPCASQKPIPESNTYQALAKTLSKYGPGDQQRIHVVTISEPMGLIPYEFQTGHGDVWMYDNPGLFQWWCQENGTKWNRGAQQQCLQILGEHIAGFLDRALDNEWYDTHIACLRRMSANGNTSIDQTHRQMLETAEAITGIHIDWLPTEETLRALSDKQEHGWQMQGVAYEPVQSELSAALRKAIEEPY